jgi:hypothetical protein
VSEAEDIARSREFLQTGVGTTTRRNKVLPAPRLPTPIPPRIGSAGPREEEGQYVEVDYAFRVLETDNSMTYNYDMMNTPLVGNMRLYLQPRPRDTTAGDAHYYASAVKLTTTDGLLKTDYQLTLQEAMVRPASGADRVCGFGVAPVTKWFPNFDLIRGPTGVHALVKKAWKIDMLVDGTPETLTLKPPPYTKPAGNGLCVLDAIQKIGDPWHGLIQGGTLRLPGGKTRPAARPGIGSGDVFPLIPYGVVPASSADAADIAEGRTWLNYGLVAGFCLYEQSIAAYGASWVYIAPDNSTWRVQFTHSFDAGAWGLSLRFYPLRRTFLTVDKGGGLVQTIFAPINPSSSDYRNGTLYDIDSKGANAVLFNNFGANRGASLINIQGIPPAATATNTLLCDASASPSVYAMSGREQTILTNQRQWHYRRFEIDYSTPPPYTVSYGGVVDYLQLANDPAPLDFLPPGDVTSWPIQWTWEIGWSTFEYSVEVNNFEIVGYCFDKNDSLQEVRKDEGYIYSYKDTAETPVDPDFWQMSPGFSREGIPAFYFFRAKMNSSVLGAVVWDYDGLDIQTAQPNAYGEIFIYGVGQITLKVERYTNKVYGMSILKIGETLTNWLPPVSPDGASIYVADIISAFKPFATYHPITQQLVWETGFVNFV